MLLITENVKVYENLNKSRPSLVKENSLERLATSKVEQQFLNAGIHFHGSKTLSRL